ncbi:MAG: aromatic ring-hydroxylating dioxygenase subunit alpha [Verrucomicrobia subdivision 3 bacterium]|nr:aromatic ring-hydroxylating dioxygenase subunit alpha [Limisphaerales bacterium]
MQNALQSANPRRATVPERLKLILANCRSGWSLPREFYCDEEIYRLDVERIWRHGWLFAGHSCEVPQAGDYIAFWIDSDSIIVIRGEDGLVRAFHNLCRHRGSLICADARGRASRLVCPYHQWTYAIDGKLLACRGMPDDLDKTQLGLHPVHAREIEGLIYVSLAPEPPDFEPAQMLLGPILKPQGLTRAKVAKSIDYEIEANWKLVWENNRECYHCNVNHPQYIKANFDHYNADDSTERIRHRIDAQVKRSEAKWAESGLTVSHKETGMTRFPDAERNIWFSANRTALVEGWMSETMDGRQVAPLMGDYVDPDVGTLRARTLPNFWNHSSCDHGVSTQLLPAGPQSTRARVTWLVHQDAVEGRDYRLDELLPFWQLTSEQDWEICKNQQRGVNSTAYKPGPYSPVKEYNVDAFVRWYLKMLA